MLSKIRIQNFKSIDDLTIDFSYAEGKAPNGHKELDDLTFLEPTKNKNDRKIPILAIYGANASGKSSIIDSLFSLFEIVLNGHNSQYFLPNKLNSPLKEEIFINIEFFINSEKILYTLGYNKNSITKETFETSKHVLYDINYKQLWTSGVLKTNIYKESDFKEIYDTACIKNKNEESSQVNTFLASIVQKLPGLNTFFTQAFTCFSEKLDVGKSNSLDPMNSVERLSMSNKRASYQANFDIMLETIRRLNIDIEKIEYKEQTYDIEQFKNKKIINTVKPFRIENDNVTIPDLISYHKGKNGDLIPFDFYMEESRGTQTTFGLIGPILKALENGGVLIVDEIDMSIHPLLLLPLIKMFKDKNTNKKNAQLIFTSHTTEILEDEDFRVSEFLFVNKSLKKGTFVTRLTDLEDIKNKRNDVNFRKRYLKGFYSGIPYPTL